MALRAKIFGENLLVGQYRKAFPRETPPYDLLYPVFCILSSGGVNPSFLKKSFPFAAELLYYHLLYWKS